MPTIDDRINRFRELRMEKEVDNNKARAAKLSDFTKRVRDLICLYLELTRSDIDIPEEFLSLDKGPGCFFFDDSVPGLRFFFLSAKPWFSLDRKKYVAVYKASTSFFMQEVWKGKKKSLAPLSDEDLDVLGRRLSEFEGCFYRWFDSVFEVKDKK